MEDRSVRVVSKTTILPATPSLPQHLFLSSLDLFWRVLHYNKKLLFFAVPPQIALSSIVPDLKTSLAIALTHFFPLAGRLVLEENGRLAIDCNDAGVEFIEASINVPFSDLGDNVSIIQPFFNELAGTEEMHKSDRCDIPLLVVQVTKFVSGGIALGVCINHVVADGHSLWQFMVSWGEIARGLPLSKPPQHDRTLLKIEKPSPERARPPFEFVESPGNELESPPPQVKTEDRVCHLTSAQIQSLKSKATMEANRPASSYEGMCAHVWKSFAKAKLQAKEQQLHFVILANCRKRLEPPLPDSYFGNAVYNVKVEASAMELCEESLGETANRINDAVKTCMDENVKDFMHWLELRDNYYGNFRLGTEGMVATSSPRFPVLEVDFGWGSAIAARPARMGSLGEVVFFPSSHSKGSVDLCMKLDASLLHNPLFSLNIN